MLVPPQVVPFAFGAALSTHAETPVAHEVTPTKQVFGFVVQVWPAVQATQVDVLSHTRLVPQVVPTAFGVLSTQLVVPVVHDVTPFVQAECGLVVQATPAVHAPQKPLPSHTRLVPQLVPPALLLPSTQVDAPVAHDVSPLRQAVGLPLHVRLAVQAVHTPRPSHTWLVPQLVPGDLATPLTQVCVPVPHEVTPVKHSGAGLVEQARPSVHDRHCPAAVHTALAPQLVPATFSVPSVQVLAPVAHEVVPLAQGLGLPVQATAAVHAVQVPLPLHT
jgi:hypothetical protein